MDTGDICLHKLSRERVVICCVHPPIAYVAGTPLPVRLDDLELIEEATAERRQEQLRALASSTSTGHRPACARQRIGDDN